jgi:hypothetical protein
MDQEHTISPQVLDFLPKRQFRGGVSRIKSTTALALFHVQFSFCAWLLRS